MRISQLITRLRVSSPTIRDERSCQRTNRWVALQQSPCPLHRFSTASRFILLLYSPQQPTALSLFFSVSTEGSTPSCPPSVLSPSVPGLNSFQTAQPEWTKYDEFTGPHASIESWEPLNILKTNSDQILGEMRCANSKDVVVTGSPPELVGSHKGACFKGISRVRFCTQSG